MQWISLEKHHPGTEEWVIVGSTNYDVVTLAICMQKGPDLFFYVDKEGTQELKFVTHWMPFPEPPRRETCPSSEDILELLMQVSIPRLEQKIKQIEKIPEGYQISGFDDGKVVGLRLAIDLIKSNIVFYESYKGRQEHNDPHC